MGSVFEAVQNRLERPVAIKTLDDASCWGTVDRLEREAKATAALRHPNVVQVLDFHVPADGPAFIVMELLDGQSLAQLIEREGRIAPSRLLDITTQVVSGLAAVHRAGTLHRDIKPDNIFVVAGNGREHAKLIDFGIARRSAPHMKTTGGLFATPAYASPEQLSGDPLDVRTDIYSLGATLYHALTGSVPFRQSDFMGLLGAVLSKPPVPVEQLVPGVDVRLAAVIRRALAKSKDARYESAEAMLAALEACREVRGSPVSASLLPWAVTVRGDSLGRSFTPPPPAMQTTVMGPANRNASSLRTRPRAAAWMVGAAITSCALPWTPSEKSQNGDAAGAPVVVERGARRAPLDPEQVRSRLASEDCSVLADESTLSDPGAVWIGTMFPLSIPSSRSFGTANVRGADLARRDFAQISGGIASATGRRALGVISCDDARDPRRAATHLVHDAHVVAVIGFGASDEAVTLAEDILLPEGVIGIAAPNRSAVLSSVGAGAGTRMFWHMTPGPAVYSRALAALASHVVEPQLRTAGAATAQRRVAFVRANNGTGLGFADALRRQLRANGTSGPDAQDGFLQVVVQDWRDHAAVDAAAERLLNFRPHVIIYMYDSNELDVPRAITERIGARWPPDTPRPIFVCNSPIDADEGDLPNTPEANELRRRTYGISINRTQLPYAAFREHYEESYPADLGTLHEFPGATYDAVYLLGYAATAAALQGKELTGRTIATEIPRLTQGKPVDVGPMGILDVFNALREQRTVALAGTWTPLRFDASDEPQSDFEFVRPDLDATGHLVNVPTGLRFDAATGHVTSNPVGK
jgi:serine/threonine-protein kinase